MGNLYTDALDALANGVGELFDSVRNFSFGSLAPREENPGGSHTPEHRSAQAGAAEVAAKTSRIQQERQAARSKSMNLFGID